MNTLLMLLILAPIFLLAKWREKRKSPPKTPASPMDEKLMSWSADDAFTIRDLVRSVSIMGSAGSGKTSSVGYMLGKALAANPRIGGLILASKPEDRALWQAIMESASREMIVVGPGSGHRFNVIDFEANNGADAREITQCIMTIGETLSRADGSGREPFWEQQNRRTIHNATEIIIRAQGKVDAWDLQRFINDAAQSGEQLASEEWRKGFHNLTLGNAYRSPKTDIQTHDFDLASQFWVNEWPQMNDKTRSSILAHTMGTLHVYNTGIVKDLIGAGTTISPSIFDDGAWVLVDMPIANYGLAGAFVAGAWKYATQRYVLRRAAAADTPVTCIWIDEYQNHITSYDAKFLAESRSHLGCMTVLTQSIHSFFSSIGGKEAQSHTKALMTNYGTKVFMALGDEESAKYASSLVGRGLLRLASSSHNGPGQILDDFMGKYSLGTSISEQYEDLIQARLFMNGLRTGGPENDFTADGWVIKNGTPFSNNQNAMLVAFSQK